MQEGEKYAVIKALRYLKFECQCIEGNEFVMSPLINNALKELYTEVFPNFNLTISTTDSGYYEVISHVNNYIINNFDDWLTFSKEYKREIVQVLIGPYEVSDQLLFNIIKDIDKECVSKK